MFYESLKILNISTLNFSEGVLASVLGRQRPFSLGVSCKKDTIFGLLIWLGLGEK